VQFSIDTNTIQIQDCHIRLEWLAGESQVFELQRSSASEFTDPTTIYRGPDMASVISGLENGHYYFRVRGEGEDWSPPLEVVVVHQSLRLAFVLFAIGGLVFILTVSVVVKGAREARAELQ
jgi:hypothetical protein